MDTVHSESITKPVEEVTKNFQASPEFRARHVLETQYMTVYLKCDNRDCCPLPKTKVDLFFPNRRIPALIPVKLTVTGPVAIELAKDINKQDLTFPDIFARIVVEKDLVPNSLKEKYGDVVPYDVYFPTQQDQVLRRMCKNCSKYHASLKSLALHKKVCKKRPAGKAPRQAPRKVTKKQKKKANYVEAESSDRDEEEIHEVEEEILEVEEDVSEVELELDASFEDYNNNMDDQNIEEVIVGASISISTGGIFEKILNLKEWLKSPWVPIQPE